MMPNGLTIDCAAKINLYLDVKHERGDGYHEIETLYQPVSLLDRIRISKLERGVELFGDDPSVPWDEKNLCHRAACLMLERYGIAGGVRIEVEKRIPFGAGLGGGSADAAAVVAGINELFDLELSRKELMGAALGIGSDVPFFLHGGPAVGRGRGELLVPVEGLPDCWILIVKPDITVSTRWAYENLKMVLTRDYRGATLKCLLEGLKRYPEVNVETFNAFEQVVVKGFPEIGELLERLRVEDPFMWSLSGSGSACFAVFPSIDRAKEVGNLFSGEGYLTFIARPVIQSIYLYPGE